MNPEPQNKDLDMNVEVQIMDLKDFYDKKTKKRAAGLEYRLENPEVTVVIRASVEITNVYVHVQRCARAAIRTHDTSGKQCVICIMSPTLELLFLRSICSKAIPYTSKSNDPRYSGLSSLFVSLLSKDRNYRGFASFGYLKRVPYAEMKEFSIYNPYQ